MSDLPFEHVLTLIGALACALGSYAYLRDTLAGRTKPNRISYLMWGVTPLIGVGAAIEAHADLWALVPVLLAGVLPLLIFCASFLNPESYWKLRPFDYICGILSLLALIAWLVIDQPHLALILAVAGDGFASYPTIKKSWQHPETETAIAYLAALVGVILAIPAIPQFTLENTAFQGYLLLMNSTLVIAVYQRALFQVNSKP